MKKEFDELLNSGVGKTQELVEVDGWIHLIFEGNFLLQRMPEQFPFEQKAITIESPELLKKLFFYVPGKGGTNYYYSDQATIFATFDPSAGGTLFNLTKVIIHRGEAEYHLNLSHS